MRSESTLELFQEITVGFAFRVEGLVKTLHNGFSFWLTGLRVSMFREVELARHVSDIAAAESCHTRV